MNITSRTQLIDLLKEFGLPSIVCEVGCAEGQFSQELLQLGVEKLYLVDIWEHVPFIDGCASFEPSWHESNYNQVLQKIKGYEDRVTILKGFSYKMAEQIPDNSLSMVYIDADHSYKGVQTDLASFYPKLVQGGIMSGHDFLNQNYGVQKAVLEFRQGGAVHTLLENGDENNMGFWFRKD